VNYPPLPAVSLTELHRGDVAQVAGLDAGAAGGLDPDERGLLVSRLRDLGFGGSTFALRRAEAAAIRVTRPATVV
jgi:Fe2+ transport system protein FeoA